MKVSVSGCISIDLLKNIEAYVASSSEFKTRSAFIEAAVSKFYEEKKQQVKRKPGLYRKAQPTKVRK